MAKARSTKARAADAADASAGAMFAAPDRARQRAAPSMLTLDAIIGQDKAVAFLRGSIATGRVHHFWVFHGPAGIGKMTAARAFAAELLTPAADDLSPQAESARTALAVGKHPDLHVVVKDLARISRELKIRGHKLTTIPKDVIEEFLLEPAARARSLACRSAAGKVFIVDEAELLDRSLTDAKTQNSMLKTLEEPPEGTVIILVTSDEQRLLPTVRSRAQRVGFGLLDHASMNRWLASPAAASIDVPPPHRPWLIEIANGSPGSLVQAVANKLYIWHEQLAKDLDLLARGAAPSPGLGSLIGSLVDQYAAAWADDNKDLGKDAGNRLWAKQMLALLAHWATARLALASSMPPASAPAHAQRWTAVLDLLHEAERQIDANVAIPAVMENLAAQMVTQVVASPSAAPALTR